MRQIELEDEEILMLDGIVNEKAQELVNEVKQFRKHLKSGHILYAEIITEAEKLAKLKYTTRYLDHCMMCNKRSEYPTYKSGRNKGKRNTNKNRTRFYGISFMDKFVIMEGYSKWGFCDKCGFEALEKIKNYIRKNDLHIEMDGEGENNKWIKEEERECFNCKEKIWEFDMGLERTLMNDGYYYAGCNKCGAETTMLGKTHHSTGKVRAVEASTLTRAKNCYQRAKSASPAGEAL